MRLVTENFATQPLFHGEKWAYQLEGQLANFTHANAVLMRLLERHGQLAA